PAPARDPDDETFEVLARAFGQEGSELTDSEWKLWLMMLRTLPTYRAIFREEFARLKDIPRYRCRVLYDRALLFLGTSVMFLPLAAAGLTVIFNSNEPRVCAAGHVWRGLGQLVVFAVVVYLGRQFWTWRKAQDARRQLWYVVTLWACAAIVLGLIAVPKATEATGGPYLQTYTLLLLCLMVIVMLSRWLASKIIAGVDEHARQLFRQALKDRQLFAHRRFDPQLSGWRVLASIVNGVIYHPLHLLLLPSLVAIMLPTQFLLLGVAGVTALAVLLLAHGSVAARWQELIELVRTWFLSGTPLLVSVAVIVLAVLRLLDVQYVATLLDAAPGGTVLGLVTGAYMTLWFVEYWINRWLAEQLLAVLGAEDGGRSGYVEYPNDQSPDPEIRISGKGRVIALQSLNEFCVQGWFHSHQGFREPVFTIYSLAALFQRLAPGTPATHDVERRIKFYFATVNLALLTVGAGLLTLQHYFDRPVSAYSVVKVEERRPADAASGDLAAALVRQAQRQHPALIVAASGGGT
ncbi:MAG TPA: hypothetical protein VKU60_16000, partial [Chloroflexota bacterium]|nr:hypothetical protein [Chloroflexota bacterium]